MSPGAWLTALAHRSMSTLALVRRGRSIPVGVDSGHRTGMSLWPTAANMTHWQTGLILALLVLGMADSTLAAMGARIRGWRENPAAFAYDELKFEAGDQWQQDVFDVFPSQDTDKLRISLQACTGPGKTAILAVLNLNFISCYGSKGEHPQGLCTSITEDNLHGNLWPALSKWQERSEYLKLAFRWTATRFSSVDHPRTWFLEARTFAKKADPEAMGRTLSGLHAKDVMVTMDESGDIPVPVLRSGEQIFSSAYRWAKLLQGGNPTSLEGALYHAAVPARRFWYVVVVNGDPDDPKRSRRVNIENAREQIELYGRDNPWVKATILGQFPDSSINTLLGIEDVEAAVARHWRRERYDFMQRRLGIDVARFGDDRTVIFPRQGLKTWRPDILRLQDTMQITARVMEFQRVFKPELMLVDDTGHWGHGVIDGLRSVGSAAVGIQFHAPGIDQRYKNRRVEGWLKMAEWVKGGGCLPDLADLRTELCTPTYTFAGGKFLLEEKEQIKKRLGRSPDLADALALTFMLPDMPKQAMTKANAAQMGLVDFDPYATPAESRSEAEFDPYES